MDQITGFLRAEDAAATVDWVVLVTAVIVMTMGIFMIVTQALYENAAESISDKVLEARS
ncbi:hypothetical protein [uncultured Gemmobacter sp.]|uniref:hypothetical protein n=1 Tax=uncultured Gemmobacter sp. TaxID=1095917 RepID=UPI000A9D90F1|nr:hypothetical protein [uncultured Gemmobacter sp.]